MTTRRHETDKSNSKWKVYSNESEKDDEVTIIVVKTHWECVKRLKNVEITLIHHDEMKELIMTMKRLIEKCVVENECKDKVYKVYLNNQASFKTIRSMKLNNDQTRLKRMSRFQTRDLLVRLVSTRYGSRHSSILRLRLSIYILQHVSRSQHN